MSEILFFKIKNTKLLVDGSLGKLARWMRMIGYNTSYYSQLVRNDIIELAIERELIIITKSQTTADMGKKQGLKCIQIIGNTVDEQIAELVNMKFEIKDPEIQYSRCSLCNGILKHANSIEDMSLIPKKSKNYYSVFYKCINCNQFYWEGSHWVKIRRTIQDAIST